MTLYSTVVKRATIISHGPVEEEQHDPKVETLLTDLSHVSAGVLFLDVLDDQFPESSADVVDGDARIERHHGQVERLYCLRVRLHPTDLPIKRDEMPI